MPQIRMTSRLSTRSQARFAPSHSQNDADEDNVTSNAVRASSPTCCGEECSKYTPAVSLIGREQEADQIWSFLWQNVTHRRSGFLSIAGKPGTGKSATLSLLCRQLLTLRNSKSSSLHRKLTQNMSFALAFCNCVNYSSAKELEFWKDLLTRLDENTGCISSKRQFRNHKSSDTDDDSSEDSAVPRSLFTGRTRRRGGKTMPVAFDAQTRFEQLIFQRQTSAGFGSIIVVLDEIDLMEKQKWGREAINRLVKWTSQPDSKLILVGCGNTLADISKPLGHVLSTLSVGPKSRSHTMRRSTSTPAEQSPLPGIRKLGLGKETTLTASTKSAAVCDGRSEMKAVRFEPYTADQIAAIIQNELENNGDDDVTLYDVAKQFLAKRIAKDSGDLRQAKDVLRLTMASLQQQFSSRRAVKPVDRPLARLMHAPSVNSEKNIQQTIHSVLQNTGKNFAAEKHADVVQAEANSGQNQSAVTSLPCTPKKNRNPKYLPLNGAPNFDESDADSAWESSCDQFNARSCSSGSDTNSAASAAARPKPIMNDATPKAKKTATYTAASSENFADQKSTPGKIRAVSPVRRRASPYNTKDLLSPCKMRQHQRSPFETPVKQTRSGMRTPAGPPCTPLSKLQLRTPSRTVDADPHLKNLDATNKTAADQTTPSVQRKKEIGVFDIVKTLNQYAPQGDQMLHKSKQVLSLKQKIILNCFLPQATNTHSQIRSPGERFALSFADLCDKFRQTCEHVKLIGANESETELYNMVEMLDGLGFLQIERKAAKPATPLKRFNSTGSMLMMTKGGGSIRQHVIMLRKSHRDIEHVIGSDKNSFENIVS